jgi:hypothetical protein
MKMTIWAIVFIASLAWAQSTPVQKLGVYEYFVDESTPVIFNNVFLMFESIVQASPQWAGHWLPAFANCSCYFRIRDIVKGEVIVNITETCNHAFGAALVTIDPSQENRNTLWVFGTPWIRVNSPVPPAEGASPSSFKKFIRSGSQWGGPCAEGNCSVNVFSSSDPTLRRWAAGPGAPLRKGLSVYNNDVTSVSAPAAQQAGLGLPPHRWVMVVETGAEVSNFLVSNGSSPYDPSSGWVYLDPETYSIPKFVGDIGSCPSIRFVPATGYYYVLTGGNTIYIVRSRNLKDWELGSRSGVLSPSLDDCKIAPAYFGAYIPTASEESLIRACTAKGFGDDSDIDLMEWWDPLLNTTAVLLQYGAGNQQTFGFSNLAVYAGTLPAFLASFF